MVKESTRSNSKRAQKGTDEASASTAQSPKPTKQQQGQKNDQQVGH